MNKVETVMILAAICSTTFSDDQWEASVPNTLDALVSSCIVVPCSFTHPGGTLPHSKLRGIWHQHGSKDDIIYHEDNTKILNSFKGRTKLKGNLSQNNCTLEIIDIKDHDNGPFCFRIELVKDSAPTKEKFSFVEKCVSVKMLYGAPKPQMISLKSPVQGKPFTVTCTIQHTCPSNPPTISWSRGTDDDVGKRHENLNSGIWKVESVLTLIPEEKDDHTDVTCTAKFNGGQTSSATLTLYVKRTENYNHIIIPVVAVAGTAAVFGLVCVLMVKKYKTRIADLQRQDGSMWNRLSRMSRRFRPERPAPSRSNESSNNVFSKSSAEMKATKPRFPSPKSQQKSYKYEQDHGDDDDYVNTADLNVYGNL